MIEIFDINGTSIAKMPDVGNGIFLTSAIHSEEDMSSDTITLIVSSRNKLSLAVGCTITVDGCTYRMNQVPRMVRSGDSQHFQYTLVFESIKYDLANVIFILPDDTVDDYLTGDMQTILNCIVSNANRVYPGKWVAGTISGTTDIETEQYTQMNCLNALQTLCENYDKKFRIAESDGVNTINIIDDGDNIEGLTMEYGHSGGLYSIERQATASEDVVTRLFVYGSSENLPTGYRYSRLCLPDKTRNESYVDNASKIASMGAKEAVELVDDIKPRAVFGVTGKVSRTKFICAALTVGQPYGFLITDKWEEDDYSEWLEMRGYTNSDDVYQYFLDNVVSGGGSNKYLTQGVAHCTWNTGALAGRTFSIKSVSDDGATIEINEIVENEGDVQLEQTYPTSGGAYDIGIGDEIVISDIELPMALVHRAESQLQAKAQELYAERSQVCARYVVTVDNLSSVDRTKFVVGDYLKVRDAEIDVNKYLLIESKEKDLLTGDVSITLSDFKKIMSASEYQDEVLEEADTVAMGGTTLTSVLTPNYDGNADSVKISDGLFTDSSLMGKRKVWTVYERTVSELEAKAAYSIYIKASKMTSYASIVFMPRRVGVIEMQTLAPVLNPQKDDSCFYFKIGSMSRPYIPEGETKAVRAMELQYGSVSTASDNSVHVSNVSDDVEEIQTEVGITDFDNEKEYTKGQIVRIGNKMTELLADYSPSKENLKYDTTDIAAQLFKSKALQYSYDEFKAMESHDQFRFYLVTGKNDLLFRVYVGDIIIFENPDGEPE